MKVGDLVLFESDVPESQRWWAGESVRTGIVVEVGIYAGRKDVKILWSGGYRNTHRSTHLEVINESR